MLVVDHDARSRAVVRAVLEADGLSVEEAPDGAAALARVADVQADPPVLVLDVVLPGIGGIEVCRRLDTSAIPVLVLTGWDDPTAEQACREAGARGFLTKPFSAIALLDAVERLARADLR